MLGIMVHDLESIPFAQVSPASAHGLEQYVQPALQFAARAWSTPEERARLAWQDACIASELRSTCAAAMVCQTALANGTNSTEHACKQDSSQQMTTYCDEARNMMLNAHDQHAPIIDTSSAVH